VSLAWQYSLCLQSGLLRIVARLAPVPTARAAFVWVGRSVRAPLATPLSLPRCGACGLAYRSARAGGDPLPHCQLELPPCRRWSRRRFLLLAVCAGSRSHLIPSQAPGSASCRWRIRGPALSLAMNSYDEQFKVLLCGDSGMLAVTSLLALCVVERCDLRFAVSLPWAQC